MCVCLLQVKPDIEKAVGTNFHVFIPISHRFQIEEGINYVVMVKECFVFHGF